MSTPEKPGPAAIAALLAVPFFFASNAVIGRASVESVGPWTLAFLRWSVAALILLPLFGRGVYAHRRQLTAAWRPLLALGVLGMIFSGGVFYTALRYTTATNGALLYTVTPLVIIVFERLFRGRRVAWREVTGMALASIGVGVIVTGGSLERLASLTVNVGDLLVLVCASTWATYTVVLRRAEFTALPVPVVFTAIALVGASLLVPFMAVEVAMTGRFPTTPTQWVSILGLAVVASIFAFMTYQYAVARVGPALTGLTLYGMPIAGVGLAVIFLGERPGPAIFAGSALVLGGVALATLSTTLFRRRPTH